MSLRIGNNKVTPIIKIGNNPTGTLVINENGSYDVTNYESADVNVSGGGNGILEQIIEDVIDGNNPVSVTALQQAETSINSFLSK